MDTEASLRRLPLMRTPKPLLSINGWCEHRSPPCASTVNIDTEASLGHEQMTWTPKPPLGMNTWHGHRSLPWMSTVYMDTEASFEHQPLTWTSKPPLSGNHGRGHWSLPWMSTVVDIETCSGSTTNVDTKASLGHQPLMWTPKPPLGVNSWHRYRSLPWASTIDMKIEASLGHQPLAWTSKPPLGFNYWHGYGSFPRVSAINMDTKSSLGRRWLKSMPKPPLHVNCWHGYCLKPAFGVNHWHIQWSLPWAPTIDVDTEAFLGHQLLTWTPKLPQVCQPLKWTPKPSFGCQRLMWTLKQPLDVNYLLIWTPKPPLGGNRWCGQQSLPWASTIDMDTEASLWASLTYTPKAPLGINYWHGHQASHGGQGRFACRWFFRLRICRAHEKPDNTPFVVLSVVYYPTKHFFRTFHTYFNQLSGSLGLANLEWSPLKWTPKPTLGVNGWHGHRSLPWAWTANTGIKASRGHKRLAYELKPHLCLIYANRGEITHMVLRWLTSGGRYFNRWPLLQHRPRVV